MEKLVEVLHIIQDECLKRQICSGCPMYEKEMDTCQMIETTPDAWEIEQKISL